MRFPRYSTPKAGSWQARLAVPAGLLLLMAIYFWPQLVQGKVLYWGDIGLYFTPMQTFLRENLRVGRVPLWNPWIMCGTPYVGNPQTWPLYPVTALLPLCSASYFLNLTVALHVWLAGVGTYLFARCALGLGRTGALLAAITFMFGGQLVSKEQFPNMVQAAAWLPWVLFCLDRLRQRRRVSDALWLGIVLGMQLLAAHPQMTLLTLYLAAAWGIWSFGSNRPQPKEIGLVFLSGSLALGLAAGQILPTLGLFRDASRQKLSFLLVNRFFLPTNELGNFVLPRLHGHPYFGDWTARGNFWETCCYVGWLPCLLSLVGMAAAWRKGGMTSARFWTLVFVVGVWMSLGGAGVLYHAAYHFLPGFRSFHDPARCLLWACFALSLLAGYGWEKQTFLPRLRGVSALLLLFAFADLAHFGRSVYPLANPAALLPAAPNVAAVQADPDIQGHQARILAPTPGVWLRFTNYKDFRWNVPDYQAKWTDTLVPNRMMSYGLREAYGYEPVALRDAQDVDGGAAYAFEPQAAATDKAQAASRAGVLAVKFVAVCRVQPPGALPGLTLVRADQTLAPPSRKPSAPAFIYLLRNTRWQPRAHLESSPYTPVGFSDDGPDTVVASPTTTRPDMLVLADTQAAGWTATVDNRLVPIQTSHGCLRAVTLPAAGAHRVVFSYRPILFRIGLYFSLLTVMILLSYATRKITDKKDSANAAWNKRGT